MVSLRNDLAPAMDISKDTISVCRDFFGFRQQRIPPPPPGFISQVSLRDLILTIRNRHFDINVVLVGSDDFTDAMLDDVDFAIMRCRQIFRQINISVGRVSLFLIRTDDAEGLDAPTTRAELTEICSKWKINNDGIDSFFPANFNVTGISGLATDVPTPCDNLHGQVTDPTRNNLHGLARTFAHEFGHCLGLSHPHGHERDCSNQTTNRRTALMNQTCVVNSLGIALLDAIDLDDAEAAIINDHCSIRTRDLNS